MPRRRNAIDRSPGDSNRRAWFIAMALVVWMAIVGVRLVQLQITKHDELAAKAKNQQLGTIETSPTRGQLLDRQGRELARSIDTESFFADPREIENVDDTARKIASITGQEKDDISSRISEAKDSNKKFIWLIRRLDLTTATKLDAMNLDGVYSRREPKRYYPNDALA